MTLIKIFINLKLFKNKPYKWENGRSKKKCNELICKVGNNQS